MTKVLVETKGHFMLVDPGTNEEVEAHRPCVVSNTAFIQTRLAKGQLKLISAELPPHLTDAKFHEEWKKDEKRAVAAYLPKPKESDKKPEGGEKK